MAGIWIIIISYAAFYAVLPLLTIFHEFGHALAHLILTKPNRITIFIGSYGNKDLSFNFRTGKLHWHIKKSFPFIRGIGWCQSDTYEDNYIKRLIVLFAGSVFTVIASGIMGLIIFNSDAYGWIKLFCFVCIIFSVILLISNLKPRIINLKNGHELDNDGKQIAFVFRLRREWSEYLDAIKMINQQEYTIAIDILKDILIKHSQEKKILELIIDPLIYKRQYAETLFYIDKLEKIATLNSSQILVRACAQSFTGKHKDSIINYRHILENDPDNFIALNNLAYALAETANYTEGENIINHLIKIAPEYTHAYGTLGYLKILNGDLDDGKELIQKSLDAEPDNAYDYKALGIYYFKKGDTNEAESAFKKAKELDILIDLDTYSSNFKTDDVES